MGRNAKDREEFWDCNFGCCCPFSFSLSSSMVCSIQTRAVKRNIEEGEENSVKKSLQGRISLPFFHLIFILFLCSGFFSFHSHHLLMFARTLDYCSYSHIAMASCFAWLLCQWCFLFFFFKIHATSLFLLPAFPHFYRVSLYHIKFT